MAIKFANNIRTSLTTGVLPGTATLNVASTTGFPTLGVGDYFFATLVPSQETEASEREIVKVTSVVGQALTVERGVDDTTAQSWVASTVLEIRVTNQALQDMVNIKESAVSTKGVFIATGGETVVNTFSIIGTEFVPATNNLRVFKNGVLMEFSGDYTEASDGKSITMLVTLLVNDKIVFFKNDAISSATGSDGVGYTPAGTGAVATTVQTKLRESVSVKDFGAVGDGVADDAAAIMAAIASVTGPADIVFPNGTFGIGAGGVLLDTLTGIRLVSHGGSLKMLANSTQSLTPSTLGNSAIKFINCVRSGIEGFYCNGNSKTGAFIGFVNCTDHFAVNNTVTASGTNGQIVSTGGTRGKFKGNRTTSGAGTSRGMWLGNNASTEIETDILVSENTVTGNPASGIIVCSNGGRVIGNICKTNEGSGIVLPGANGYPTNSLTVTGNTCLDNLFHGIQSDVVYVTDADCTHNITITGNVCSSNNRGSGAGIYAVNMINSSVASNTCNNNVAAGIQLDGTVQGLSIVGNVCRDVRVGGARTQQYGISCVAQLRAMTGVSIGSNSCSNNTVAGIRVSSLSGKTITGVSVVGNSCVATGVGIFLVEAVGLEMTKVAVSGNTCTGNTTDLRLSLHDVSIGENAFATQTNTEYQTFTNGDTTPNIAGRRVWRAANTGVTAITAFNGGVEGQEIIITSTNGNTTVNHGGLIVNTGAANITIASEGWLGYRMHGTVWRQMFKSF